MCDYYKILLNLLPQTKAKKVIILLIYLKDIQVDAFQVQRF